MFRCAVMFRTAAALTLLVAQGVYGGNTVVSIVPIGTGPNGELAGGAVINGSAITLTTDGVTPVPVFLEFRIGDWDPNDIGVKLNGWQIQFDSSSLTSGSSGALTFYVGSSACGECSDSASACFDATMCTAGMCSSSGGPCHGSFNDCPSGESCIGAASCSPVLNANTLCEVDLGTGTLCGPAGYFLGSGTCGFVYTDSTRADFVLANAVSVLPALDVSSPNVRPGGAVVVGPPDDPMPFPTNGLYAATLALLIPPDAQGTFTISAFPFPGTQLISAAGPPITPIELRSAQIRVNPGRCCFNLQLAPGGRTRCADGLTENECAAQSGVTFFEAGGTCADPCPAVCGDNLTNQFNEQCDGTDDSACPGLCRNDCQCGFCGDGIQTGSEQCDGADDAACPGLCLGDCTCAPVCGDNVVNQPSEMCDGTDNAACPGICLGDCTCNPTCGDVNGDGDADMLGAAIFMNCFTGSGGGPVAPECGCAKFDADDDIDLDDLVGFLNVLNGP